MTLESLTNWREESSIAKDQSFQELRAILTDFLLEKGTKIRPKGIQNIVLPIEWGIVLISEMSLPSMVNFEYKSEVFDGERNVPIEITTDRLKAHSGNPKRANIDVQIGEEDCAIHYHINEKLDDSTISYINDVNDRKNRTLVKHGSSISSKEAQDLTNLLISLK